MSENPFASPQGEPSRAVGVRSGRREDLRKVAQYQKGVLVCLLINILIVVGLQFLPEILDLPLQIAYVVVGLAGAAYVFLLSRYVYNTVAAVLLTLLMFIPCINLLVLLGVTSQATRILQKNGIRVGLLGADPSEV